jgi:oligoendopeptidase F
MTPESNPVTPGAATAPGKPSSAGRSRPAPPVERTRDRVPERYRWNLGDLYPDDDAWRASKAKLESRLPGLERFRGTLGTTSGSLLGCLAAADELSKEYLRLGAYAGMKSDQDTRDSAALAMQSEIGQLGSGFASAASYIEPEILAFPPEKVDAFLAEEPGLALYSHYLGDVRRRAAHTGTPGEERIIAEAGLVSEGPGDIYGVFSNADFPYPIVALADGTSVTVNPASFSVHRASGVREDRRTVFEAFFSKLHAYRRTFGAQLNAQMRKDLFFTRARRYPSCLDAALHGGNIPTEVYRNLIASIRRNLPTFHRYLRLRKRLLGLDALHYHDLYAPLVKEVDRTWSYEEARDLVLASVAPLGAEYARTAARAFDERWMDVYPTEGKRSGAYSNGAAYDVHPYILLNYNGKYDDVSTITHELGHTMHSWYSNTRQPYATSHYSIFVAEVASTFNEALLFDHVLRGTADAAGRLSLLGHYLEHFKATVFRQTQFAEFELLLHEAVERGEALTGDSLDALYLRIAREYYGHDAGVCTVDDHIRSEWSYIPHFYYNFYVFQYATSFCASSAICERVLAGDDGAMWRYIDLLSAGGSDYPIELLKRAGVDMGTTGPVEAAVAKMDRIMDEMERLAGA